MQLHDPERRTIHGRPAYAVLGEALAALPELCIMPLASGQLGVSVMLCTSPNEASWHYTESSYEELPALLAAYAYDPERVLRERFHWQPRSAPAAITLADLGL